MDETVDLPVGTEPSSRRAFLAQASLLGIGLPALGAALAGCGKGGEQQEGAQHEQRERAAPSPTVPFRRYDPALPPLGAERTHRIDVVARDVTVPISPSATMRAWTFDGTIPGPIYHVREGDEVVVTFSNQGAIAHSIDFHAAQIDWSTAFRSIPPGASLSYTFRPSTPGAYLYHCGTEPIVLHIGSGMYGAIIVDPPTPLPPAREFVLVHSSFYLGDLENGAYEPSLQKMLSAFPDEVAFNGHAFQYRKEPITVKKGDLVRFYVVNAGPTQDCSFHVVGEIFDTVYVGAPPGNAIHGVQTYNVPAGGGMIFELKADVPGKFPFVNHKFGHGDKGAVGLLVVEG